MLITYEYIDGQKRITKPKKDVSIETWIQYISNQSWNDSIDSIGITEGLSRNM